MNNEELQNKIIEKVQDKIAIFELKKEDKKMKQYSKKIANIAATVVVAIGLSVGTAYAGTVIYEKIWKEPTKISQEELDKEIEKIKEPITKEEKEEMINNEEAIEIVNEMLQNLGYDKITFKEINIVRGYDSKNHYILSTETDSSKGIVINLNPITGEFEYFCDNNVISKDIKCDDISEEVARDIANDIYKKLNIIPQDEGYEIVSARRQNIVSGNIINDMWQVSYAKKYNNNTFDEKTTFTVAFKVVDGKTIIHIIKGKSEENFENNSVIITKDEAIKIASEKEKEFSTLEISEVSVQLSIEKMNIFVYALENNITNTNGEYQVDDIDRNVWVVEIKHNKDRKPRDAELETVKQLYNKKYFIDATTGEIIGGEQSEFFQ